MYLKVVSSKINIFRAVTPYSRKTFRKKILPVCSSVVDKEQKIRLETGISLPEHTETHKKQ
jgi:hypothetical protein